MSRAAGRVDEPETLAHACAHAGVGMATLAPASAPPIAVCAHAGTRRGSAARRAPRRVAATRASGRVADASVASDARPSPRGALPRCVGTVTRTDSRGRRYEFYVVGTVHTPGCASAEEVREVIERVRPDAVVLELDQERLDITVARSMVATSAEYGADLLAGAVAAERLGALVVLGDAKARSLPDLARAKMLTSPADLADLPRLWRSLRYLGRALGASADAFAAKPDADAPRFVRFAEALAADPGKLVPLRGPAAMAALALIASAREGVAAAHGVAATPSQAVSPLATLATLASSVAVGLAPSPADAVATALTALVAGRATEVLLEARDEVLAASAARAAAVAAATDRGALRRVAHAFDADADATAAAAASARADADAESSRRFGSASVTLPCFTLRRPLRAGETRRLNLFEPRWLAMIDAVAEARGGDPRGAEIACGLAVNRRYVSRAWLRDVDAKDPEARREDASYGDDLSARDDETLSPSCRSADLVVEPFVRVAKIVDVREGTRAVTGARRLEVFLQGGEETRRAERFEAHPAGYLRATLAENESDSETTKQTPDGKKEARDTSAAAAAAEIVVGPRGPPANSAASRASRPVRVVCVVGLAHCNGVLSRLADANVEAYR